MGSFPDRIGDQCGIARDITVCAPTGSGKTLVGDVGLSIVIALGIRCSNCSGTDQSNCSPNPSTGCGSFS